MDRPNPSERMAAALSRVGGVAPSGQDVAGIRDRFGSNAALAHALVRDSGPVSQMSPTVQREYKTWMRDIQRWTKESGTGQTRRIREPGKMQALQRVAKSRMDAVARRQLRENGATVSMAGQVRVSGDSRYRGNMPSQDISPADMGRILDAWESGSWGGRNAAMNELEGAFFDAYGIPGAFMEEITRLEFDMGG